MSASLQRRIHRIPIEEARNPADRTIQIVIIGDSYAGKTSFSWRAVRDIEPSKTHISTIGADYLSVTVAAPHPQNNLHTTVQLWDTAGSERFAFISRSFMGSKHGAVIVFDLSSAEQERNILRWAQSFREASGSAPILLIGNKADKDVGWCTSEVQERYIEAVGAIGFEKVSALDGTGIDEAFTKIVDASLEYSTKVLMEMASSATVILSNDLAVRRKHCCS